jgi:hypothetical protein
MAGYLINKKHSDDSVVSIRELDGYTFRPRPNSNYIKVNKVTIVDRMMIDRILSMKFDKAFNRVVRLALKVINDDDATGDDCEIILGEVELVRQILLNRYQKYINQEKEKLFLKKLRLIENEMRMKQVQVKQKAIYLEQMEINKGRGM